MNDQPQQSIPAEKGGPIGGPAASNPQPPSPPVDDQSPPIPSGNSGAPRGTTAPAKRPPDQRISASAIDVINSRLSDRDRAILRSVDDHQFLTVHQIEALHFDSIAPDARGRITRRVLARLRGLRVLGVLNRRIGGVRSGSQGLIYHVGVAGERLLERPVRRGARLRYDPSARFLNHRLAVADHHVALITADRDSSLDLIDSAVEPSTWRSFTGLGSARRTLKPDLFAETATRGDDGLVRAWFIEVDLGTEHVPTLLRKCHEYEAYRQSGIEQDRHGSFPVVIWSMSHADPAKAVSRRQALEDAVNGDPRLPSALFRIVTPEQLLPVIARGGER
ncbi:replication-relaxation family protein [Mycolicibacterium sp. 120266]|uniref:replication-relaxation family protein n=1 Tax=Mycolicibacterium sp. 120266 TaxID=3090601 RepID=UPI00299F27E0|nr:replication-relaxation family protein [Mycolicibacterium sp. 120266]MDX1870716.1 replication-relaxation family protein [Mycolicibacterium sp. 120266]